jgi:hypothetical protein
MFGVEQQPVEARAGEQFGSKAAGQAAPQTDLLATRLDRAFETVFRKLHGSLQTKETPMAPSGP